MNLTHHLSALCIITEKNPMNLRVLNKELDRGSSCHAEHTSDKNSPENSPSLSPRKSRKRSEMLKIAIPLIPKNIEFS
jgi:hypothetical protein